MTQMGINSVHAMCMTANSVLRPIMFDLPVHQAEIRPISEGGEGEIKV
jgi:hypothetical protein